MEQIIQTIIKPTKNDTLIYIPTSPRHHITNFGKLHPQKPPCSPPTHVRFRLLCVIYIAAVTKP